MQRKTHTEIPSWKRGSNATPLDPDWGTALEERSPTGWPTVAFASRFLNSNEKRYSFNEIELLGVVWSVQYFKFYLFGKSFTIITDHRALLSVMKEHRSF